MLSFTYEALPHRVVFGVGALDRLTDEALRLGIGRALVLATPGQRDVAEAVAARLGDRAVGLHAHAAMHVPVTIARAATAEAARLGADGCVAVGGGSTIGLAKAIALETGLPILAVPTTYAGSEMTPVWGLTEGDVKRTGRDPRVLPKAVIYDPSLTVHLPAKVSAASGLNAIAHAVEALYSAAANPITSLMAEESIRALATGLPALVRRPDDLDARSSALYGASLAGACLGAVGMGLHHQLCHVLGGLGLPHAETHAVILPHAAAYNRNAAPEAMARIAQALGAADAPRGLFDLATRIGAPTALAGLGLDETLLDQVVERVTAKPYPNPRRATADAVRTLLDDAFHGRRPS